MQSTLILSASYEPLEIVSAKTSIKLILNDKAVSIDDSPTTFRAERYLLQVPYVALLHRNVRKVHRKNQSFSRRGVLARDNFLCVYCGKKATTIDHVIPSSIGGGSTYENCVAACQSCNSKKDNKSLKQMGWKLGFTPIAPSPYFLFLHNMKGDVEAKAAWLPYIEGWATVKV